MGNVTSWLAQCIYPEEQVLWQAARSGDALSLRASLAKLTPETRKHIEWMEPCSGRTALAEAAHRGNRACVVALVEHGANCNGKDYRGNTPLHLACKKGRDDVVQFLLQVPSVFPFETNVDALTPLDVVRRKIADDDSYPLAFERCLEELEKKFCIFSGWLYEEQDNVLSMVSGISSLSSWKRRFCIVLERGAPDILELALFSMKPGGSRPVCPKSVVLYHVAEGMMDATDSKWFNRKDLVFTIRGNRREKRTYDSVIEMETLAFAAVDQQGYDAWKRFFTQQQQALHARASELYGPPVVRLGQYQPPHEASQLLPVAQPLGGATREWSESKPAAFVPPPAAPAAAQSQEDEDLRRAIWLSLQAAAPAEAFAAPSSPPLPVSAPDWDDVDDDDDGQSLHSAESTAELSSATTTAMAAAATATTDAAATTPARAERKPNSPVVGFARAPSYSSIGECVICFDGPQAAVCVPCGHNAICMSCAEEILETTCECPVCRHPIRELIKLYRV